jgi:hypothetical protein
LVVSTREGVPTALLLLLEFCKLIVPDKSKWTLR